jgi:three-Cys-motif partner protein
VAKITDVVWERPPHTAAKHQMLDRYLAAWFPILLQGGFPGVTFFDGFAGPGEYKRGEEGSPIIALRQVFDRPELLRLRKRVRFVFIEAHEGRVRHLHTLITSKFPLPNDSVLVVPPYHGRCEELAERVLHDAGAWGQPIFANLDAWSLDVPLGLIRRIGRNKASEVLITFPSLWFRRFGKVEETDKGDRWFGSRSWRAVEQIKSTEAKKQFLVDEYRCTLRQVGFPMTLAFEMLDEDGSEILLIFGTSNKLGLERMKDAMWKVDPVYGLRFRDPRDPLQAAFAIDDADLFPLMRSLRKRLAHRAWYSVKKLKDFTLLETAYRPPHATTALRALRDREEVELNPPGRITEATSVRLR